MTARFGTPMLQLVTLTLWLGAAVFFAAAVAPALFSVLPTRSLAGAVVGRLLPIILYAGIVAGVIVLWADIASRGGLRWRGRAGAAAVMIVACGIAQWVIGPRIERVRAAIPGALDDLALDDPRRIAFGRLHGLSVAWLGVAMIAAAVALVIAVRRLDPNG